MNILNFKYTKSDGKTTDRVLLIHGAPSKLYAGTDISSLDMEAQVSYSQAVQAAKDIYLATVKALNDQYDLNYNYRQFDPTKMSEVVEEEI